MNNPENSKSTKFNGEKLILFSIALLTLLFCVNAIQAQVLNFDVPGGIGGTNYSGQGGYSDPGNNYWNPITHQGTTTPGTNSDGVSASPITLTDTSLANNGDLIGQGAQGTAAGLEDTICT